MDFAGTNSNRNYGCRLMEFVYRGHRCVTLENELLRVTVIADKGSDIYEFLYKPRDVDFMFRSRIGLRMPSHLPPSTPRPAGPHMDHYEGGWQEMFPNCGPPSIYQGAEIGQHGEVHSLPWTYSIVRDDASEVAVRFEVATIRTPFRIVKELSLRGGSAVLTVAETLTNEGGHEAVFIWGHHPALGAPFLEEGCRIYVPECSVRTLSEYTGETSRLNGDTVSPWPLAPGRAGLVDLSLAAGPRSRSSDMAFLEGMKEGWLAVANPRLEIGFAMRYPVDAFKHLWYWHLCCGGQGYPFWGSAYALALEPCMSLPVLSKAAEAGAARSLGPGEHLDIEILAIAYEGAGEVEAVTPDGLVIQPDADPEAGTNNDQI